MSKKIDLALIYGSTREGRFCDTVAGWAVGLIAAQEDFSLDVVDLVAIEHASAEGRQALRARIGRAEAFVVVTPEYNHSYPAPLKALIDTAHGEWWTKPVAFVSYGGVSGGLRAVEHLRHVFAELHAVGIRDGISFANARGQFDPEGRPHDPEAVGKAMATMLGRLAWWALALREARQARAYPQAVA